jgi:hypothetical protein
MEDAGSRWGDSYLCQASSIESIKAETRGGELNVFVVLGSDSSRNHHHCCYRRNHLLLALNKARKGNEIWLCQTGILSHCCYASTASHQHLVGPMDIRVSVRLGLSLGRQIRFAQHTPVFDLGKLGGTLRATSTYYVRGGMECQT